MEHPRFSSEEIARRGKELYENELRSRVETEVNIGKIIAIDIETGDYEIDDDLVKAAMPLHEKRPGAAVWGGRIGYDAVYAFGSGMLTRTAK